MKDKISQQWITQGKIEREDDRQMKTMNNIRKDREDDRQIKTVNNIKKQRKRIW